MSTNFFRTALLVATSLTFVSVGVRAETPLTLKQVLGDVSSAPQVRRAGSTAEEYSWKRVGSYSGFLPTLSFGVNRLFDKQWMLLDVTFPGSPTPSTIPQIAPTTNYTLNLNWNLFDGLANVERWQSAKAMERAARADFDWAQFSTQRQLTLMYYRALASKTLREVAEQNVKALQDHLNDTKLFKKAGLSTNFDLLRVEVQLSEAQSAAADAKDNEVLGVLRLSDVTNRNYMGAEVGGLLPTLDPKMIETLGAVDPNDRRDLVALTDRVEGLDRLSSAASAHWIPRVGAFAQYQYYNNRGDKWTGDTEFRDARMVGVQLTWPIFEGFASTARSHEAVEQKYQAELSLAQARMKAQTDFEFWKRKYAYFTTFSRVRQSDVAKAVESVRLAREGRRVGSRTNTDFLDAEAELFRARAGLVNAQIGAIEALISLELSTGKSLYRFE